MSHTPSSRRSAVESLAGSSRPAVSASGLNSLPRSMFNGRNSIRIINEGRPAENGGFGHVYRGIMDEGEHVALKLLHTETPAQVKRRIRRESEVWRRLRHDHILPFLGLWHRQDDMVYMVSPWIANGHIMKYLQSDIGRQADRRALLTQAADALVYLHGQDIVHGDIKGRNILVSSSDP
ncbi:hypothetical protein BOTBODRAFT_132954, partial [Botryobasidium botryosum FD-172 SS1]